MPHYLKWMIELINCASFEDLNPNRKLVDNEIIERIMGSVALQDLCQRRNVNWNSDEKQEILESFLLR